MLEEDRLELESQGYRGQRQIDEFGTILSAIDIAESQRINLHVNLLPLGHTDFGIYTVFPHCPFCKALAKVVPWQQEYPSEHSICHVCGTEFSPRETASWEKMDWDRAELRDVLGQEQFEKFATAYLIANGEYPNAAAAIVRESEAAELHRKQEIQRYHELERLKQHYLEQHVFIGLDCLPTPRTDFGDAISDPEETDGCTGWFSAENLAIVLQRCQTHGITITLMKHSSAKGEFSRFEVQNLKSPQNILSQWVTEGCNESFYALCRVPDSLVT
jgi:hypothetical protein